MLRMSGNLKDSRDEDSTVSQSTSVVQKLPTTSKHVKWDNRKISILTGKQQPARPNTCRLPLSHSPNHHRFSPLSAGSSNRKNTYRRVATVHGTTKDARSYRGKTSKGKERVESPELEGTNSFIKLSSSNATPSSTTSLPVINKQQPLAKHTNSRNNNTTCKISPSTTVKRHTPRNNSPSTSIKRTTPRNNSSPSTGTKKSSMTPFVAMHGGTVKAVVDSGRNTASRPTSSSRRSRNSSASSTMGAKLGTLTSMLPWNNPKLSRKRIPIVSNPPFELRKKKLSVRDLAKAHQRKRRSRKKKKEPLKDDTVDDKTEEETKSRQEAVCASVAPTTKYVEEPEDELEKTIKGGRPPTLNFGGLHIDCSHSRAPNNSHHAINDSDDEKEESFMEINHPESDDELEQTYEFTSSGAFNIQGFQIQENGITRAPDGGKLPENLDGDNHGVPLVKLAMLGKGASGVVHEMLHVPTYSLVAVKSIPCFEQSKRHQMIKELKALYSNLVPISAQSRSGQYGESNPTGDGAKEETSVEKPACPYIVAFHDAFISPREGHVSIVMEYMDGGSLQDVVEGGGCDCESVLANIADNVARALLFLHNRRQIHRDIKPSNLLINHKGEVKVSDFGIVREVTDGQLDVDTFVGTMIYMSPERINGNAYSFASDIWSYGLSLLTLALGKFPISTSGGYWGMLHSLNNAPLPSLPSNKFSSEITEFINLCLAKDPAMRPSAGELLLHPFLANRSQNHSQTFNVHEQSTVGGKEKLEELSVKLAKYKLEKVLKNSSPTRKSTEAQTPNSSHMESTAASTNTGKKKKKRSNSNSDGMGHCTCSFKGNKCAFCMTSSFSAEQDKKKSPVVEQVHHHGHHHVSNIPKVSKLDSATLADQIGLCPGFVQTRLNLHIAKANEYLRRYRLYNSSS